MEKLPTRARTHSMEDGSRKLFESVVPNHWVVRNLDKVDYGIDALIEVGHIKNEKGDATMKGELVSIQLKSMDKSIPWNSNETYTYSGIKWSTANYWLSLDIPVFLVAVDLEEAKLFYANASSQIRKKFGDQEGEESLSILLDKSQVLDASTIERDFYKDYVLERSHKEFALKLLDLILHQGKYVDFLIGGLNRDSSLPLEPVETIWLFHIVMLITDCCDHLGIPYPPIDMQRIYDHNQILDTHYCQDDSIYEWYRGKVSHWFLPWLFLVIPIAIDKVLISENAYWKGRTDLISYAGSHGAELLEQAELDTNKWWEYLGPYDPFCVGLTADPTISIEHFMLLSDQRKALNSDVTTGAW